MILIRTHQVDDRLEAFARELEQLSGLAAVYLVDERRGVIDTGERGKVSLTIEACANLGLYCPRDFAWRCGDYGFYLARERHPEVPHFWLIENDVRIKGRKPRALFDKFANLPADLLGGYLERPAADWPWLDTLRSRDAEPAKTFFPVVRLSAPAIDTLLAKRQAHSRRWARRRLWANDEGFVGTTLVASGGRIVDLNDGEPSIYRRDQFSFEPPIAGDLPLHSEAEVALFHPVLFGDALRRKQQRLAERAPPRGLAAQAMQRAGRIISLDAVARAINRRSRW